MARKEDNKEFDFKAAVEKFKQTLSQKLPSVAKAALDLGIASSILVSVGVIAQQSPDQLAALVTLLSQLGLNWLAQIVVDMRNRAGTWQDEDLKRALKQYQPTVELQLTDAKLREFVEQLDLAGEWLKALNSKADREQWLKNAAESGLFSQEALERAGNNVNLKISGDVIDSIVVAAGGDINNLTIKTGAGKRDLKPYLEPYKNDLIARLSPLALGGVVAGASRQNLELAQVYTPLFSNEWKVEKIEKTRASGEDKVTRQLCTAIEALSSYPRAVILGGAGSGKSTVLNYLALGLCGAVHDEEFTNEWRHRGLLPIVVTLRRFGRHLRDEVRKDDSKRNDPCAVLIDYVKNHRQEGMRHVAPELADAFNEVLAQRGAVWLLDGLDEVHAGYRGLVQKAIEALAARYPKCRYVVTCRTYSYRDDFQKLYVASSPSFRELPVRPFEHEQIKLFVQRWYDEVARKRNKPDAPARAPKLIDAIQRKSYLRRMASSPLLVSLMADLHSSDNRELPDDRWVLLKEALELLIFRWQLNKSDADDAPEDIEKEQRIRAKIEEQGNDRLIEALSRLAYKVHKDSALENEESTADIAEADLTEAIKGLIKDFDLKDSDLADYLCDRAGLIVDDGGKPRVYRFPHRIFQEFLAAYAMRNKPGDVAKLLDADEARWREIYALIALMKSDESGTRDCVQRICSTSKQPQTRADWRRVLLAGEIWRDRRVSEETKADVDEVRESIDHVRGCLRKMMSLCDAYLATAPERADAANLLARLGIGDLQPEATDVDKMQFCFVPRGPFILGSDKTVDEMADDDEVWGKPHDIGYDYLLGRFPVTNAQYAEFVRDPQGYADKSLWVEAEEALVWREGRVFRTVYFIDEKQEIQSKPESDTGATAPSDFVKSYNFPNHPVVGICWYEALAFARWLNRRWQDRLPAGWEVTLPTETEWEKAARGGLRMPKDPVLLTIGELGVTLNDNLRDNPTPARRYAYSNKPQNQSPDQERMNYNLTYIGETSAVGCFPCGMSPNGAEDMNGNVWEWTLTRWQDLYSDYKEVELNKPDGSDDRRVLRGGTYFDDDRAVRCAFRGYYFTPDIMLMFVGLRVVVRSQSLISGL
jgi:formylglycine-generating enzyme required for sulfatase activity